MPSSSPFFHTLPILTIASPFLSSSTQNPEKSDFVIFPLDKPFAVWYNHSCACGRGGIGIRARLRGVSSNGYGFKSRRPHQNLLSFARKVFLCALFLPEHQIFLHSPPRRRDSPCNAKIKQQKNRPAAAAQKADCPAHFRMGSGIAHAISALSSPICGARYTCSGYASSCENT